MGFQNRLLHRYFELDVWAQPIGNGLSWSVIDPDTEEPTLITRLSVLNLPLAWRGRDCVLEFLAIGTSALPANIPIEHHPEVNILGKPLDESVALGQACTSRKYRGNTIRPDRHDGGDNTRRMPILFDKRWVNTEISRDSFEERVIRRRAQKPRSFHRSRSCVKTALSRATAFLSEPECSCLIGTPDRNSMAQPGR